MKNDFGTKDSSKMKGFYLALLSCVGILVVVAIIINFNNYNSAKKIQENKSDVSTLDDANVNVDKVDSVEEKMSEYLDPADDGAQSNLDTKNSSIAGITPTTGIKPTNDIKTSTPPTGTMTAPTESPDKKTADPKTTPANTSGTKPEEKPADSKTKAETKSEENLTEKETKEEIAGQKNEKEEVADKNNAKENAETSSFAASGKMNWPIFGDILMDYSTEHVVYDKTLDMYRTNDSISIASAIGAEVKATADGTVKSVSSDLQNGKTIVIDNGNGWATTYSQLQDNILVKEGDVVKAGQVIGNVGTPTKFSVLLGSHLQFKVTKNDQTVDPKSILTQQ